MQTGPALHAALRVEAPNRRRLEQLCRYITRPALSDEDVQTNAAGQFVLKFNSTRRDNTTHLLMSPLEFTQRHFGWPVCAGHFRVYLVGSGSGAPVRKIGEQSFGSPNVMARRKGRPPLNKAIGREWPPVLD